VCIILGGNNSWGANQPAPTSYFIKRIIFLTSDEISEVAFDYKNSILMKRGDRGRLVCPCLSFLHLRTIAYCIDQSEDVYIKKKN
jgi:hypothetical protein